MQPSTGNVISKGSVTATSFIGNASSATKLATARTLTIGSKGKTFNGSANVSWTLAEIGAAPASHTHSYLPLSGGTVTGKIISDGTKRSAGMYGTYDPAKIAHI